MVLCQMSKLGCAVGCLSRDATRDVLLLLWEQKTCLHPFGFSNNNNKALLSLCDCAVVIPIEASLNNRVQSN